ncbi:MAG: GNAT family protein [Patescibacteria group bacterium]
MEFEIKVNQDISLRLRKLSDVKEFFEVTDKNRARLREWFPWVDNVKGEEDEKKYIEHCLDTFKNKTGLDMGIWYQGKMSGSLGFHDIDIKNKKASIEFWIDKDHERKGIITTATKALINYGFNELGLNRIDIGCAAGNIRSCAVPERLNFKFEGIEREYEWLYDHFVDIKLYSVLKKEWKTE